MGRYRYRKVYIPYRSLIEALYTLNSPPVVSFKRMFVVSFKDVLRVSWLEREPRTGLWVLSGCTGNLGFGVCIVTISLNIILWICYKIYRVQRRVM